MRISNLLTFVLLLGIATSVYSQSKFEKKGDKLMRNYSFQAATESYLKAIQEDKNNGKLKLKLAQCYQKLNDPKNTALWYKYVIQNEDLVQAEDKYNYAMALMSTGDVLEAENWFNAYDAEKPNDTRASRYLEQIDNVKELYRDSSLHEIKAVAFNSVAADFSPAFYRNGIVFVSGRTPGKEVYKWNESAFLDLYFCAKKPLGMFDSPSPFHQKINSNYHEGPVSFYQNDQRMVLTRNNFEKGKLGKSNEGITKLKLYFSSPDSKEGWGEMTPFVYNSDEYSVGHPTVSADGTKMYFISDMPGGYGGTDLYVSHYENSRWTQPKNLGEHVNTEGNEMFPYLMLDEKLYFSSNGRGGLGGLDIFELDFSNEKIRNLGYPINSPTDDFGYIINEEGEGFLSSNRNSNNGADNIYQFRSIKSLDVPVKLLVVKEENNQPISRAMVTVIYNEADSSQVLYTGDDGYLNLPLQMNRSYSITAQKSGFEPNIKSVIPTSESQRILFKLSGTCIAVKGRVRLSDTEDTTETATVVFENGDGVMQDSLTTAITNPFEFCAKPLSVFYIKASKEGYFTKSVSVLTDDDGTLDVGDIVLEKIVIDKAIKLDNIYYDLGKWDIREDAAKELDKLVELLVNNPTIEIELSSHTDSRGGDSFNLSLSEKRAKSAAEYIVSQGIETDRISYKGYGETRLINGCANGVNCTKDQHQANRRTEFKVLKF